MHVKGDSAGKGRRIKRAFQSLLEPISSGSLFLDAAFTRAFLSLYFVSFAWIFLIPADFWDDLAVKNNPEIVSSAYQLGIPITGWLLKGLLSFGDGAVVGRVLVFLLFIGVGYLVRRVVADLSLSSERERNAIAMFTSLAPLFLSRFQFGTIYYCLSLFLFCAGSLLLIRAVGSGRPMMKRVPAYICFASAFFTQSFLALYGFVVLLIILSSSRETQGPERFTAISTTLRRAPDVVLFPFCFFFAKLLFVPARGPFSDYNAVTLRGLGYAVLALPVTAIKTVIALAGSGPIWLGLGLALLIALAAIGLERPAVSGAGEPSPKSRGTGLWLVIAYCGLMIAVLPYAVVNHAVSPYDFLDRNQLTMIPVIGAVIVYGVTFFVRVRLQWIMILAVLVWAVVGDISGYCAIILDGHIQNAVVRAFSRTEAVRENKAFLVDTSRWPDLSRRRIPSTAQINCLMKEAFGDETRFAAQFSDLPFDWAGQLAILNLYRETGTCFRGFAGASPLLLTITPGPRAPTLRYGAKLSFDWLFEPGRYQGDLDGLVSVRVGPMPNGWLKAN